MVIQSEVVLQFVNADNPVCDSDVCDHTSGVNTEGKVE